MWQDKQQPFFLPRDGWKWKISEKREEREKGDVISNGKIYRTKPNLCVKSESTEKKLVSIKKKQGGQMVVASALFFICFKKFFFSSCNQIFT
jgi:hypothetical protein